MTSESSSANRRRVFIRDKEKETEREEHAEKSKKKYESRTHILENKMQEWDELLDDDLCNSFRTEFAEWIDENFKLASITIQKKFKAFLRARDVWVMKSLKLIIAKSLAQVVEKDTLTSWTEEKIRSCLKSKTFVSHVIIHLLKTNFERNSKNYSWQASSQSESKHSTESRMQFTESYLRSTQRSSSRERSVQEKSVTREMQQSLIRSFHQSSIRHSLRESSITRNFLRQSSSSSSSSEVQEILSSEISEISENLYSHQSENSYRDSSSSQSKNPYIRQSKKKSMLRQSFKSRFSKFYQSSQLPKQFYRRSTEYSSFVSSRLLPHEYSLFVSSRSFASSSSFSSVNQSINTSDYERELVNLIKLYTDEAKYSEKNDNFSFKLIMFNDMCDRIDVSSEAKLKALLTMFKGLALNYYYKNMTSKNKNHSITFDDVCVSIMSYFEDAEYKRSILNKWNNITLKTMMSFNEYKSMNECLQLMIKELRHLQHDLESILRIDDFIHNKLVNACQEISACQYACFKPSDSLTELINDLKSSIVIYQKAHFTEFTFSSEFTFFTDRRYHRNFPSRISQNREYQNRKYQNRKYQDQRNQGRTRKVCFVCQKEECWSTKHTKDEREDAKRKFKNRFVDQMNKRIDQYIAEYEELDSDENDQNTDSEMIKKIKALMIEFSSSLSSFEKNSNAETFIITFEPMKNLKSMISDLINRSFSHYLIDFHTNMNNQILNDQNLVHLQISLKNESIIIVHTDMKNIKSDSFAYVMTFDRYISEKFYEIMIDSNASTKSTAEYDQYLAFKKNKIESSVDLDFSRAETVNVQFEIELASSIKSLTIDTSFEVVKFHVIKTDTSFLLSLADMNRLKVYFNNVINSLI